MFSLIYRSLAKEDFKDQEIRTMLLKAKKFNQAHNITGCLLYHQDKFVQLLEGEEASVINLYERIEKDDRHEYVTLLHAETIPYRIFTDWSMVYNNLNDPSDQIRHKRMLFSSIFNESDAIVTPNRSKLVLWKTVQDILKDEDLLSAS